MCMGGESPRGARDSSTETPSALVPCGTCTETRVLRNHSLSRIASPRISNRFGQQLNLVPNPPSRHRGGIERVPERKVEQRDEDRMAPAVDARTFQGRVQQ